MASRRLAPTGQQLLSTDLGSPLHILVGRLMARVDALTTEVTWLRSELGALWAERGGKAAPPKLRSAKPGSSTHRKAVSNWRRQS